MNEIEQLRTDLAALHNEQRVLLAMIDAQMRLLAALIQTHPRHQDFLLAVAAQSDLIESGALGSGLAGDDQRAISKRLVDSMATLKPYQPQAAIQATLKPYRAGGAPPPPKP